jgi:hypothetical protein
MPNLDGTEKLVPTPFDAHDQVVRASNPNVQEYPKAVDHVENNYGPGLEPVVVNSPEEEAAHYTANAPEQAPEQENA